MQSTQLVQFFNRDRNEPFSTVDRCRDWVHLGRHALELALLRKELEICRSEAAAQIQAPCYLVRPVTLLPTPFGSGTPWRAPALRGELRSMGLVKLEARNRGKRNCEIPCSLEPQKQRQDAKNTLLSQQLWRQASYQVWTRPSSVRFLC